MTMENSVRGRLSNSKIPDRVVRDTVDYLSQKGYDEIKTSGSPESGINSISFSKKTQLESIVTEIVPKVERLGWNAWTDLELSEYDVETGDTISQYRDGRVFRRE